MIFKNLFNFPCDSTVILPGRYYDTSPPIFTDTSLFVHVDNRVGNLFHRPSEGGLAAVGSVNEQHPVERGGTILLAQAVHVAGLLASLGLLCGGAVLVNGNFAGTVGGILADDNGISLGDEVGIQIVEHALDGLAALAGPGHVVDV